MRRPTFLDGPPPPLPDLLDRASEAWWSLTPRLRAGSLAVLVLLLGVAASIHSGAEASVRVLVATKDLAAGDDLVAGSVAEVERSVDSVPDRALDVLPAAVEAIGPIPRGAVVTELHVSNAGLAAVVGPGLVATAVPADALPAGVTERQRVDLLAATPDGQTRVLASGARVLAVGDAHVWFELGRDEAAAVASAAAWGQIGVALLPDQQTAGPPPAGGATDGQ